jgi:UDP-N-acetylglucosamine 2-epimerase (non-hydrolysing)
MKIAVAAGTRPEFIQIEPLIRELEKRDINYIFIHSGQHYDYELDKIFFEEMKLPSPTHYLDVGSISPGEQVGEILMKSEKIFLQEKPDILLISGDTNTTLGISLSSNKAKIKIGHLEAGMRSFDRSMPEEINRIVVDNISNYLFPPTKRAMKNLYSAGIKKNVFLVGDIMLDSLFHYRNMIKKRSKTLNGFHIHLKEYLLLTIHREANTDNIDRLKNIIKALSQSSRTIIFPIHPRTKNRILKFNIKIPENFKLIEPVGYFEFLRLISHSYKVITDSGGVQKQAFFLSKPCITLRSNTEWIEIVEDGWNILVDDKEDKILDAIQNFNPLKTPSICLFGDGKTSKNIVDIILNHI